MAIAIWSNGWVSYPFLSAGSVTAVLAAVKPGRVAPRSLDFSTAVRGAGIARNAHVPIPPVIRLRPTCWK
jgi:hypothetical protein